MEGALIWYLETEYLIYILEPIVYGENTQTVLPIYNRRLREQVNAIYDYLIGVTIVGVIFVAVVFSVPTMNYLNLLYVDQQQLRNIALETFKTMLLTTGSPLAWGSRYPFSQEGVRYFGLAYPDITSSYRLDSDKVQRLVEGNPIGYIGYGRARDLLGLSNYGFNIRIGPPFKVKVTPEQLSDYEHLQFNITVTNINGIPIPNAAITVFIFYSIKERGDYVIRVYALEDMATNSVGTCEVDETLIVSSEIEDAIVVLKVGVSNLKTMMVVYQSTPADMIAEINMVNTTVILTMPKTTPENPEAARWVDRIMLFNEYGIWFVYNGTRSNEDKLTYWNHKYGDPPPGYKVWSRTFSSFIHDNPVFLVFGINVPITPGGRRTVLVAGPSPNLFGSRVVDYGGIQQGQTAVKVYRTVIISGLTYTAEMTLWKEL